MITPGLKVLIWAALALAALFAVAALKLSTERQPAVPLPMDQPQTAEQRRAEIEEQRAAFRAEAELNDAFQAETTAEKMARIKARDEATREANQ